KRISTRKDGIVRILSPITAAEIQVVEKERKAKNILLMAIPKECMRRFHGMDDAKEIWEAIRTRFGGNSPNTSGEEQVEDISPNTLEAAKTLSRVASLKPNLDFQEEVDTGAKQVNTAEGVNTGSIKLSTVSEQLSTGNEKVSTVGTKESTSSQDKGQREGKAPMLSEETPDCSFTYL
ncbi:hypothetical protein Tco_0177190, partial [Tanacetum coccineum]